MSEKRFSAILAAGGSGTRFGGSINKGYLPLDGQTVIGVSLDKFLHHPLIAEVIVVYRQEDEEILMPILAEKGADSGIPLLWDDQGAHDDVSKHIAVHENGAYTLYVQDRYAYDAVDKWNAFTEGLNADRTGADAAAIHFLSTKGTAAYGHPYAFAKTLNRKLLATDALHGWIVIDFADATLAAHIYEQNF